MYDEVNIKPIHNVTCYRCRPWSIKRQL